MYSKGFTQYSYEYIVGESVTYFPTLSSSSL
jgi:hypothetical protein